MITSTERKNYNRVMILLVLGILIATWIMVNAQIFILPVVIYIVLGMLCIFFYNFWDKIKPIF
jgi:hypothetical protein